MTVVGVDQGIKEPLDAEPVIARAHRRLAEHGLAEGLWIITHLVRDDRGAHTACALVIPTTVHSADALVEVVAAAFDPEEQPGDSESAVATTDRESTMDTENTTDAVATGEPLHHHAHAPTSPASVWVEGASRDTGWLPGAQAAVGLELAGELGRAVVYPGVELLTGAVAAAQVTELTGINQVTAMGGELGPDTMLQTRDHVRPTRHQGHWRLVVQPAIGGVMVPFEAPEQHDCCSEPPLAPSAEEYAAALAARS